MFQTIRGLVGAFQEGMAYWSIANRHEDEPAVMAAKVRTLIASLHEETAGKVVELAAEAAAEVREAA